MELKSNAPKAFVFVVMPFADAFRDTYEVAIKPACNDAGAHCERVDEQIHSESILARVLNQIAKADLVVAVMTGRNSNVFYEVGYAHALGKQVVLLTDKSEDIPFDLAHHLHIIYGSSLSTLKSNLQKHVAFFLEQPKSDANLVPATNLEFFHDGTLITDSMQVEIGATENVLNVHFDVHNPSMTFLVGQKCKIAVVSNERFKEISKGHYAVRLPDGRYMTELPGFPNIFPDGWGVFRFQLARPRDSHFVATESVAITLRIFTEIGPRELRLTIRPDPRQRKNSFTVEYD